LPQSYWRKSNSRYQLKCKRINSIKRIPGTGISGSSICCCVLLLCVLSLSCGCLYLATLNNNQSCFCSFGHSILNHAVLTIKLQIVYPVNHWKQHTTISKFGVVKLKLVLLNVINYSS